MIQNKRVGALVITRKFTPSKPIQFEVKAKPGAKKDITEKKLLHPYFEAMSELITDEYWKSIFISCSRGKFPPKFSFRKSSLYYRFLKTFMIPIDQNASPEINVTIVIDFFKKHGNLSSKEEYQNLLKEKNIQLQDRQNQEDREDRQDQEEQQDRQDQDRQDQDQPKKRRDRKKSKLKGNYLRILVLCFVERLAKEYKLTNAEFEKLFSVIIEAITLQYITEEDIEFDGDLITNISTLDLKRVSDDLLIYINQVYNTPAPKKCKSSSSKKVEKNVTSEPSPNFFPEWKKFVNNECKKNGWVKKKRSKKSDQKAG
jgi:hypothetical protein